MVTGRFRAISLAAAIGLAAVIASDLFGLAADLRFNRALLDADPAAFDSASGPRALFAKAYRLQQRRAYREALQAYAAIDPRADARLRIDVKYNLANLFFREALRLREVGAADQAMPLLELAKQSYKEILRADNDRWNARYNLELALTFAPETDPVDTLAELNPERSPRALVATPSRRELP